MKQTNWYKDAVIYQIYPRSFCDSNGDGVGDIPGIISKLDYLKELGVNCVWLSPVYNSPQEDNGYDISDYRNIYPPFGTMDDFKKMLDGMHERGIRLIMDLVVNHTSSEHVWFQEALKDPLSPYRDYYYFKKGRKNGKKPPNNWSGFFGKSTWERVGDSDEYYLHLFAKGQPDLNWENSRVRQEVKDILKFWLDLGVDGFRCDVITLISKKQDFKSRFPSLALTGKDAFVNGPRLHEYLHELNKDVISNYDAMTVGETVLSSLDDARALVDPKREELSMVFNFDHTDTDNYLGIKFLKRKFKVKRLKKVIKKWQLGLFNCGWNSLFIENHDQRRSVGRFGTDEAYREVGAKMLGTFYFFLQGTPFIYEGQEIGMTNAHFSSMDEIVDVESHDMAKMAKANFLLRPLINKSLFEVSRDNARTPMQWDDSKNGGFSSGTPWIRSNSNYQNINAKESIANPISIFHYYQKLINIRKNDNVIKHGDYVELLRHNRHIFAYSRNFENEQYVVICSFSKKDLKVKGIDSILKGKLLISNYDNPQGNTFKPYEARVYKLVKEK